MVSAHPHTAVGIKCNAPNPNRRRATIRSEVEIIQCTRCGSAENALIKHGHPHITLLIHLDISHQALHLFAIGRLGGVSPELPGVRVVTVGTVVGAYPYYPLAVLTTRRNRIIPQAATIDRKIPRLTSSH